MTDSLPNGWCLLKLSDFTNIVMGQSPPSSTYNTEQIGLPFYQGSAEFGEIFPTTVKWCSKPKKIAEEGSILISVRAPVGPTNINPQESCIGRGLASVKAKYEINDKYLLYLLRNSISNLVVKGKGSTFQSIVAKDLRSLLVAYPPIEIQTQIAKKLDELFSIISNTNDITAFLNRKLLDYRFSVLKYVFDGNIFTDFENAREKISDLYEIVGGGTPSTGNNLYWGEGTPWVTSADIDEVGNIQVRRKVTDAGIAGSAAKIVPKDSILVVTRVGLGKVATNEYNLCTNQDIQSLINPKKEVNKEFILHMLKYASQSFAFTGRGTTIKGITKKTLLEVTIPKVSLSEQSKAVDFINQQLSVIDNLAKSIGDLKGKTNILTQAILKYAFNGNLVKEV